MHAKCRRRARLKECPTADARCAFLPPQVREYASRLPPTSEELISALQSHSGAAAGTKYKPPVMCGAPLDVAAAMRAVAELGGWRSVTDRCLWKQVFEQLRPTLVDDAKSKKKHNVETLRTSYARYLLPFEDHVAAGAPTHTVQVDDPNKRLPPYIFCSSARSNYSCQLFELSKV